MGIRPLANASFLPSGKMGRRASIAVGIAGNRRNFSLHAALSLREADHGKMGTTNRTGPRRDRRQESAFILKRKLETSRESGRFWTDTSFGPIQALQSPTALVGPNPGSTCWTQPDGESLDGSHPSSLRRPKD